MIIRVFRAVVHPGRQPEFERFFLNKALPKLKAQPGVVSVTVGKPLAVSPNEFMMTTVWRDLDALKGFAGENWQNAVIDPDEAHLLKETFVHHYEAAAD
jgi:heme-degrading monooxygenase HmoA